MNKTHSNVKKVLFIFGTRPEAIKMAPVIKQFTNHNLFKVATCSTGQHLEMLDQVVDFFKIDLDFKLNLMTKNQSINSLSSKILIGIDRVLSSEKPDFVFVHGDTTTTALASVAAFHRKNKICHIEAGLRTYNKLSPFPEEMNRTITSKLADFHFCPTIQSKENLLNENIKESSTCVTGNTVIDSLFYGINKVDNLDSKMIKILNKKINFNKKVILVTGHRRENFGQGLRNICNALLKIAKNNDVEIVYPVHLNPNVKSVVDKMLNKINNIHLIDPLNYPTFIWVMNKAHIILTDSGGIQEEAPSLGIPVLVMRDTTERPEGIVAKTSILVGTKTQDIIKMTEKLLTEESFYNEISTKKNPYGDGKASERILNFLLEKIGE